MSSISVIKKLLPNRIKSGISRLLTDLVSSCVEPRFTRPYIRRKCVEGIAFDFYIGDADGMVWYDTTCTDPFWPEMRIIRDHLISEGDVVFDVGAHHGCTAILFSNWTGPGGKVVAIEPNPHNVRIIETNIGINRLRNVEVLNVAVAEAAGRMNLSLRDSNSFLTSESGPLSMPVDVIALDSLLEMRPSFLKFDVEGADVLALRGARDILRSYPKLAIEVHKNGLQNFSTDLDELLSLIDFEAYDCWIQWNYEREIGKWQYGCQADVLADGKKMVHGTHIFAKPKRKR